MGGRRTTKQELEQIEALTLEGLTSKEIAERLNRSPASIRNLRYKKRLVASVKNETGELFQQRDELVKEVEALQIRKASLTSEVNSLIRNKQNLEATIGTDKFLLQQTLAQALITLKQQRPDLFYMTSQDQIKQLVSFFMNATLKALK